MPGDPYDTPAMRQFTAFKREHPGCVLFFRMGDFYELFGDDAVMVSKALGLTLTERTKGMPMAGVPYHQLETYLRRAIDRGFRVAVADQVQDPREAKGVVERAVTRVVTPGTLVDESLLDSSEACAVAAISLEEQTADAAIADLSTGAVELRSGTPEEVADALSARGVRELIHGGDDDAVPRLRSLLAPDATALTAGDPTAFDARRAPELVMKRYGVQTLDGFGLDASDPVLGPLAALLEYLARTQAVDAAPLDDAPTSGSEFATQRRTLAHLRPPTRASEEGLCVLDAVSRRALEVERVIRAEPGTGAMEGALLGIFLEPRDGSGSVVRTPMGRRLLRARLLAPLADVDAIRGRQDEVAVMLEDTRLAAAVGGHLGGIQDVERIAGRIALGRATPRDLVALARSCEAAAGLCAEVHGARPLSAIESRLRESLVEAAPLAGSIAALCVDEAPATLRQGGLIRDGVDAELDEARALQRDAGEWLADYQARLDEAHDLPGMKVGFNKVFGYYIELPAAQARRAPDAFTRKQTLKNAERYITPELKTFEEKVSTAEARALARERELFQRLLLEAAGCVRELQSLASAVAALDVSAGLAEKARRRGWVRPEVVDRPVLEIEAGRHPVLDETLGDRFVPNGVSLGGSDAHLSLITGPNMAGKSTFIRQVALLAVLASAGGFVPAERATIGVCDRIFTRVGADDALHRGQSTFMVEMAETAAILNGATPRSLVILDEIGRGTSTLDGLSLAWAIAERLGEPGAPRALFATHYHELTELAERDPASVKNLHVAARVWRDEIVFLHEIKPGAAEGSYGVHVAKLAGIPASVTDRASEILESLRVEHAQLSGQQARTPAPPGSGDQMALFTEFVPHPAVDRLRELKLDALSPLEAFDELRRLLDLAERAE